jgi:nucleoid DNA-binding protein/cell division septation protein DedD
LSIFVESLNNNVLDIFFYIKDLLLKRDGLVVPGLGSFITENQPSKIDQTEKKLIPPKKKITFNPSITRDDDHILANTLMSEENLSFEDANETISKQVERIKQDLQSNKKFEIPGLGTFTLDENNKIEFSEVKKEHETLGLIELEAEPLEQPRPSSQRKTSAAPPKPSQRKAKTPQRKTSRRWYWIAAVIILLIGIGGASFYFNFWNNLQVKNLLSDKETGKQKQKAQKTSVAIPDTGKLAKINKKIDQFTDKKKALMYKEQKKDSAKSGQTKTKGRYSYHLVVGSFKKRANAEEFSKQVKEKGFKPTILERDNLYRVVVKSFNNKSKALVSLYHMRDTGKIKSVWLLTVSETNQQ